MPRVTLSLVLAALTLLAGADTAVAQWGANWGEFSWGASLAAVPALGRLGIVALVAGVVGLGAWLGRSRLAAR